MKKQITYKKASIIALCIMATGCSLFYGRNVVSYADYSNISYAEAEYQLSIQHEIGALQSVLVKDEEHFAGLYIEHKPSYSINVLYKDKANIPELDAFIAQKSWRKFVKVHQVNLSNVELRKAQKEASEILSKLNIAHSSSGDVKNNSIKFHVLDKHFLEQELLANDLKLHEVITIIEVTNFGRPE